MQTLLLDRMATPIGELILIADEQGLLRAIDWADHQVRPMKLLNIHCWENYFQLSKQRNPGGFTEAMQQYFAGELAVIDHFPIMTAGSEFQRTAWWQLRQVPCGEILSLTVN